MSEELREKVIKGLRCIAGDVVWCAHCPYSDVNGSGRGDRCKRDCAKDALALLKAQQPRVMTLEEVRLLGKNAVVWYEYKSVYGQPRPKVVEFVFDEHITFTDGNIYSFSADSYGERWRLWTSRPDDKVRAKTPWASDT